MCGEPHALQRKVFRSRDQVCAINEEVKAALGIPVRISMAMPPLSQEFWRALPRGLGDGPLGGDR
jgi:hypothetical protein